MAQLSFRRRKNRLAMMKFLVPVVMMAAVFITPRNLAASEVIGTEGAPIELEMSKGTLIKLDRPATNLFVVDPEIADIDAKSPTLVYVYGKRTGETTIYALDASDRMILGRTLTVTHNLSRLQGAIDGITTKGTVAARSVDGALVLDGSVDNPAQADQVQKLAASFVPQGQQLINRMGVTQPTQVHLRVRMAEMSRDLTKQLGINLGATLTTAAAGFAFSSFNPIEAASVAGNALSQITGNATAGSVNLTQTLDMLDQQGLVSILAEPNLTAVSGQTASFLAGGEFPIIVPQDAGRFGVEFKEFGVSLSFTPTLISANRIVLNVKPEVSQLSTEGAVQFNGFNIPALTTRRTQTTVELGSGQSFAIAGLLQNNLTQDVDKYPGLGEVPVLGTLFKSDRFRRNETELVIVVTPYLVEPVSTQIALPTDGLTAPHDVERIFFGKTLSANPATQHLASNQPSLQLAGPVGFQID